MTGEQLYQLLVPPHPASRWVGLLPIDWSDVCLEWKSILNKLASQIRLCKNQQHQQKSQKNNRARSTSSDVS